MQRYCKECQQYGHFRQSCPQGKSQVKKRVRPPMDKAILDEWIEPDFDKGVLRWKKMPAYGILAGQEAGSRKMHGNVRFALKGQNYEAHQVLWFLYTGQDSPRVYHKNKDVADNRISNLTDRPIKPEKPPRVKLPKVKPAAKTPPKIESVLIHEAPEVDALEEELTHEAMQKALAIQPRRDPMIWSMFGAA